MRLLVPFLMTAMTAGSLLAQDAPPAPPVAPDIEVEPPAYVIVPETATTPEALANAEKMLAEVMKAYRSAPTLSDKVDLTMKMSLSPMTQQDSLQVDLGRDQDVRVLLNGLTLTSTGGKLFIEQADSPKKFVEVPVKESGLVATMVDLMQGNPAPIPHIQLRFAKAQSEAIEAFSMGALTELAIIGSDTDSLFFKGREGKVQADIDSASNLISAMKLELTPPNAPPGIRIMADLAMTPKVSETLERPIAFDPAGRTAVASMEDLAPTAVTAGQEAPLFTLSTLSGESISLESLRGRVVVLDFWATWCGPCRQGLPDIQKVHEWAASSGKPVNVFAVNVWERGDADARKKVAGAFWESQKFTMPTLMDLEDRVIGDYGFRGIPTTVIIDPKGRIFKIHDGIDPSVNMVDAIKAEIEKALETTN